MHADHFERLGFPRRFVIDTAELERAYFQRSRQLHPDFHTHATAQKQNEVLHETAAVNEAYLTLKDPFRRAEYLHWLLGGPTAAQHKEMPQMFLMEMLDLREQIESVTAGPASDKLENDLQGRLAGVLASVAKLFDQIETLPVAPPNTLLQIRQHLNSAKVLTGLLRDLRARG